MQADGVYGIKPMLFLKRHLRSVGNQLACEVTSSKYTQGNTNARRSNVIIFNSPVLL